MHKSVVGTCLRFSGQRAMGCVRVPPGRGVSLTHPTSRRHSGRSAFAPCQGHVLGLRSGSVWPCDPTTGAATPYCFWTWRVCAGGLSSHGLRASRDADTPECRSGVCGSELGGPPPRVLTLGSKSGVTGALLLVLPSARPWRVANRPFPAVTCAGGCVSVVRGRAESTRRRLPVPSAQSRIEDFFPFDPNR